MSSKAAGKRRAADAADKATPQAKRRVRWLDGEIVGGQNAPPSIDSSPVSAAATTPKKQGAEPKEKPLNERTATSSAQATSAAAQEEAKVHYLLKAIRFVRC